VIIRTASHENDGDAVTSRDKAVLQVKAAQPGHLYPGDKARCVVELLGFEKIIGRAKRGIVVVAQKSHEPFRRIAHGFIVIDNRNQYLRHSAIPGPHQQAGKVTAAVCGTKSRRPTAGLLLAPLPSPFAARGWQLGDVGGESPSALACVQEGSHRPPNPCIPVAVSTRRPHTDLLMLSVLDHIFPALSQWRPLVSCRDWRWYGESDAKGNAGQ